MADRQTRRGFVKTALASTAAAAALSREEQVLLAQAAGAPPAGAGEEKAPRPRRKPGSRNTLPTGRIAKLKISRLIMGGNLISGYAHSRDLLYLSRLLRQYFTPEKILETLEIAEAYGINTINTNPRATEIIRRYRKEYASGIRWIVQAYLRDAAGLDELRKVIDSGADAIYLQGANMDRLVAAGKIDLIGKALEIIRAAGLPAGVAGHDLETIQAVVKAALPADFYVKTLHTNDYFTARRPDQPRRVVENRNDNFWCVDPDAVIEFMAGVEKPWIAYKVMAAGAIPPRQAFTHAFNGGADFVLAGMFDFQVAKDVHIAREVLAKVRRTRPWRA